jgi:hypothetical protein
MKIMYKIWIFLFNAADYGFELSVLDTGFSTRIGTFRDIDCLGGDFGAPN